MLSLVLFFTFLVGARRQWPRAGAKSCKSSSTGPLHLPCKFWGQVHLLQLGPCTSTEVWRLKCRHVKIFSLKLTLDLKDPSTLINCIICRSQWQLLPFFNQWVEYNSATQASSVDGGRHSLSRMCCSGQPTSTVPVVSKQTANANVYQELLKGTHQVEF